MRVRVQALGIHRDGGPTNHLQGFLRALSRTESDHEWMFVLDAALPLDSEPPANVYIERVKTSGRFRRLYEDLVTQRSKAERGQFDVLVNLADFGPIPKGLPTLSFQRNPNYFDRDLLGRRHGADRVEWELRSRLARHMVIRSDRVLCPSETMAEAVRQTVPIPADRVGVLYHPHQPTGVVWAPTKPRRILYTGHLMPHKNHRWLLEVFTKSGLAAEGVELWTTAARDDWPDGYDSLVALAERYGVTSQVRLLGRVPPSEMPSLYGAATVFVFASAGESFGFPMVEALSAGLPVLAYDTPIAREILGSAAEFLPHVPAEAAEDLRTAMGKGEDWLEVLHQRSLARAAEFCKTWDSWLHELEVEIEQLAQTRAAAS